MLKQKSSKSHSDLIFLSKIIGLTVMVCPSFSKCFHFLLKSFSNKHKYNGPAVTSVNDLLSRLKQNTVTPEYFVSELQKRYSDIDIISEFEDWIYDVPKLGSKRILFEKKLHGGKITLQIFYISQNSSHPPHAHHNVLSNQCVLKGQLHLREYDRVSRVDRQTISLQPIHDRILTANQYFHTTEYLNNVHWFGATDEPAIVVNFNVKGFLNDTFDSLSNKASERAYLDLANCTRDEQVIYAEEITQRKAYYLFSNRALRDFDSPFEKPLGTSVT